MKIKTYLITGLLFVVLNPNLYSQANFLEPEDLNFYRNQSDIRYERIITNNLYPEDFKNSNSTPKEYQRAILVLPDNINEREKGLFFFYDRREEEKFLMLRTTENLFSRPESETGRKIIINEIIKPFKDSEFYELIVKIIKEETSNVRYQNYEYSNSPKGDKFIFIDYSLMKYKGGILWENRTNSRTQLLVDLIDELLLQMSGYVRQIDNTAKLNQITKSLIN